MKVRNMALCALFAALLCVCAWISVPVGATAITMQTFGIFLTLSVLGGKRGSIAIAIYVLLGVVGLPVFSGFQGGVGALLGPSGGYLYGFMLTALLYWLVLALGGEKWQLPGLIFGLLSCYACGCLWFAFGYLSPQSRSLGAVLTGCVLPYLLPDAAKLILAWLLGRRLRRFA